MTAILRKSGHQQNRLQRFAVGLACAGSAWLMAIPGRAEAQTRDVVPASAASADAEGPLVLRLPVSARWLALGGAGLVSNDADAVFLNPGALTSARGTALSIQRYGTEATAGSLAMVSTAGPVTIAIGGQFLDWRAGSVRYGDILSGGAPHLSDGGPVAASSSAFTLGLARVFKGWRIGAGIKYAEDRLGDAHDGTMALDLGVARPLGYGVLTVVAQNMGAGLRLGGVDGALPTRVGLGYGVQPTTVSEWFDAGAHVSVQVERDGFLRVAAGGELAYVPIEGVALTVRSGLRRPRESDESPATAGLGFTVDHLSIDYAIEPMRGGRPVSHRIGLRIK